MKKSELRQAKLAERRAMDSEDAASRSRAIGLRLVDQPEFSSADTVLSYVSSKDNEVDTLALVKLLLAEERAVLAPSALAGGQMKWHELDSVEDLHPGRFGILEPGSGCREAAVPLLSNAVVIVPGVAFDRRGYRVGYGGGYFDRFLPGFRGVKIGLAFELQIVGKIEVDEHDQSVDMIVTETQVYRCSPDTMF